MKKALCAAVTVSLVMVLTSYSWAQKTAMYDDRARITVNGDAVVTVEPNKIIITLGIETWDVDVNVSKQKNVEVLKKAVSVAKKCGVSDDEIQTVNLSIEPRYKEDYQKKNLIGFFIRNNLVVTLNAAEKIEELITAMLLAGVNYIQGIDFQTTDYKKYREQARELALKAAKEKAEKMAAVFGQQVGSIIQITDNFSAESSRYNSGWGFGFGGYASQNVLQNVQAGGSSAQMDMVSPGKISIRSDVTISFELLR